jgi:hypothetical protein
MTKGQAVKDAKAPSSYHVMELFKCPPEALNLDGDDRRKFAKTLIKTVGSGGFKANENEFKSSITIFEELVVILVLLVCMGAPWTLIICGVYVISSCTWPYLLAFFALVIILMTHPLPKQVQFL